jgi:hypothetical protein
MIDYLIAFYCLVAPVLCVWLGFRVARPYFIHRIEAAYSDGRSDANSIHEQALSDLRETIEALQDQPACEGCPLVFSGGKKHD